MTQELKRKYQDHLAVSGGGVLIFGIWSLIKGIIYIFNARNDEVLMDTFSGLDPQAVDILLAFFAVVTVISLLIDIGLRLIVGLNAIGEGHGRKKGIGYIVVAVIFTVLTAVSFAIYAYAVFRGDSDSGILEIAITVLVDITSLSAFLDVIISAIRLRKINRLTESGESA